MHNEFRRGVSEKATYFLCVSRHTFQCLLSVKFHITEWQKVAVGLPIRNSASVKFSVIGNGNSVSEARV